MAVIAWWLVKQTLNTAPWARQAPFEDGDSGFSASVEKIGLWVFLAVITSLFCLLISAYVMRMHHQGDWRTLHEPGLLWVNTGILVLSSIFMERARIAAARGKMAVVETALNIGGACALAFMIGQLLAWHQLDTAGYFIATNPANAFFYLITGLHGLHLAGGMVAWGRTSAKLWHRSDIKQLRLSVDLCATYWHFLLAVWLVMFGLLLST